MITSHLFLAPCAILILALSCAILFWRVPARFCAILVGALSADEGGAHARPRSLEIPACPLPRRPAPPLARAGRRRHPRAHHPRNPGAPGSRPHPEDRPVPVRLFRL